MHSQWVMNTMSHERSPDPIATAVHDLRQPLASILLTAQAGMMMIDRAGQAVDVVELRGMLAEIVEYDREAEVQLKRMRGQ